MKKRILIVDDNEMVLQTMLMALSENEQYIVEATSNPLDAYDLAALRDYDLLILDVNMVPMRGDMLYLSVAVDSRIDLKKRKQPKLLLVSGYYTSQELKEKVELIGGCDYMEKPFDSGTLSMKVASILWKDRGPGAISGDGLGIVSPAADTGN